MKVLLYQWHPNYEGNIVLWDGKATYWSESMQPSYTYEDPAFIGCVDPLSGGKFTYIGELEWPTKGEG